MRGYVIYIPYEVATTPIDGHCYVNRWWVVHPEKGVLWYIYSLKPQIDGEENPPSPQCNADERTALYLKNKIYPDCDVLFIPVIYEGHAIKEQLKMYRANQADKLNKLGRT